MSRVPDDPAVIDPTIAWAIGMEGKDPKRHDATVTRASSAYHTVLTSDAAGQAAVERKLKERYEHPVITRDGALARIDLGVIPGKPMKSRGVVVVRSPLADGQGLVAREVIRNLQLGLAAHPDATTYQVEIDVPAYNPGASSYISGQFTYVYSKVEDRIRVYQSDRHDRYYVTGSLKQSFDQVKSLDWSALEQRPMDKQPVRSFDLRPHS
jgi:hypothetical protein